MKMIKNILVLFLTAGSVVVHSLMLDVVLGQARDYDNLDWLALLPDNDRMLLMNMGPVDHGSGDTGGPVPALGAGRARFSEEDFANVWHSVDIVPEFDGRQVRVPGFVVPLEYDGAQRVTEFFLVPYFGACIHMPAPPPNQIIFISMDGGFDLKSIYEPYVVEGQMQVSMTYRDIGISAYSLTAHQVVPYNR